jgi:hypothetical protein
MVLHGSAEFLEILKLPVTPTPNFLFASKQSACARRLFASRSFRRLAAISLNRQLEHLYQRDEVPDWLRLFEKL